MMLLMSIKTDILESVNRGIYGVLILLDGIVYRLVSALFELFYTLAGAQLLDNTIYEAIAQKVYLFVGIIALFSVSVALLKTMANPDEAGKAVVKSFKSLITSVLLVILMPTIFQYAYSLQGAILSDDIIGKIFRIDLSENENRDDGYQSMYKLCDFSEGDKDIGINLGDAQNVEEEISITKIQCQSNYITMEVMEAFITPNSPDVTNKYSTTWNKAREYMILTGNFNYVSSFVDQMLDGENGASIDYSFLISTAAGCVLIYVILSFCIDLGVRTAKLAFYQLISPIPILMRMIPGKEGQFDKWSKSTISTFADVFVRLIIINFIVFILSNLFEIIDSAVGFKNVGLLAKAVLALGLFMFGKQAPKLLSEALGFEAGNLKFGIKGKLASGGALALGSGVGAGATTLTRNAVHNIQRGVNNYKNAGNGWDKTKAIGGAIIGGTLSAAAGGVSGFARGVYAGKDAKNYKDVKTSASKGAEGAIDKRNKRESYKASHDSVVLGHLNDMMRSVGQWSGIEISTDSMKKELDVLTEAAGFKKKLEDLALKKSTKAKLYSQQIDALNESVIKREDYSSDADYSAALTQRANDIDKLKRAKNFELMRVVNEKLSTMNTSGQIADAEFREVVNSFQTFKDKNARISVIHDLEDLTAAGWNAAFNTRDAMTITEAEFNGLKTSVVYTKNHKSADDAKNEAASRYAERIKKEQEK